MALDLETRYPGRVAAADADYPHGSFKDRTAPGDGTPLQADWGNDIYGFLYKLITAAGITPSGVPDTAVASDYYNALVALFAAKAHETSGTAHAGVLMKRSDIVLGPGELQGRTVLGLDATAAAWTSLDLSGVLPAGTRWAICAFELQAAQPNNTDQVALMSRPFGNAGAGILVGSINAGGTGGELGGGGQAWVPVPASRVVQLKLSGPLNAAELKAWYHVLGYIL